MMALLCLGLSNIDRPQGINHLEQELHYQSQICGAQMDLRFALFRSHLGLEITRTVL
jgi:hypothetical protein